MHDRLERAISELVARQRIADTLARFCERIDEYDVDGASALFTEDCITDYGPGRGGVLKGREALRERLLRSQKDYAHTHHQLGQVRIDLFDGVAQSIAYLTAWHQLQDSRIMVARLQYRDSLVHQQDDWAISMRVAQATGLEGFEPAAWNWLVRRRPGE